MTAIGDAVDEGAGCIAGFVNAYVVEDPSGTCLIDTTMSKTAKPVREAFERAGISLSQIRTIVLTHEHIDRVRGAAEVQKSSQAIVACHATDAPFVDGTTPPKLPALLRLFVKVRPVAMRQTLGHGDRVDPLEEIFVPCHTVSEVAFYHAGRTLLFSGDAVVERSGVLTLPAARFAADLRQAVESLRLLCQRDVEILLPGHGVPVRKNVQGHPDDLIARAPRGFPGAST